MPFQKGNKLSTGRKGYEVELKDLKRMRKLFRGYLTLAEKVYTEKATPGQVIAFERLKPIFSKLADKLHANKADLHIEADKPLLILK